MPTNNQLSPGAAFQIYGMAWIAFFVMALVNAFCCSLFKVPLYQAVNVQLAATLATDIALIAVYLLLIVLLLLMMQIRQALLFVLITFLFTFWSLAPIAAFQVWAMFSKVDLLQESFMYAMVLHKFESIVEGGLSFIGGVSGQADLVRYWPVVKDVVTTLSGLVAIAGFFVKRPQQQLATK